jgi:hypothetical protein
MQLKIKRETTSTVSRQIGAVHANQDCLSINCITKANHSQQTLRKKGIISGEALTQAQTCNEKTIIQES